MTLPITRRRVVVSVAAFATLASGPFGANRMAAQTPEASPAASPAAEPSLPDGPLGEQIQWLLETANGEAGEITVDEVNARFDPAFLAEVPVEEVVDMLSALHANDVTYAIELGTLITTMDFPATNGRFVMVGSDGSRTEVAVQIERDAGLIVGLLIQPAVNGTPEASPVS